MRRLFLVVLALSIFPVFAHAQGMSIYFTSVNTRFTNVQNGQSYDNNTSTYTNLFTTSWPAQFGGGLTFNAVKAGPLNLGLDFRGSTNHGNTGADTAMFGPRLALRVPIIHIKPYIEAAGGYVATRTIGTVANPGGGNSSATIAVPITNQYAAWEIFGGVDVPIFPHLDFRAVEFGGGKGYLANAGISNINFSNTNTQISLISIDTGIVVHF
jgi:hypothetical protein